MMRICLQVICIFTLPAILMMPANAGAQTFPAQKYINIWKISDRSQTSEAAVLYDDLSSHKDSIRYFRLISELENRIDTMHERRLSARLVMFKALWTMETLPKNSPLWLPAVMDAVRRVYPLNDKQLDAELYALYGELSLRNRNMETSLFYNLKSLALQEQIGADYFPKIGWMYLSVARALYNTGEFELSRQYALKCLRKINTYPRVSTYDRIFLYDILGATFKKTNQSDSAAWYFRSIAELIRAQDPLKPETEPAWSSFWLGLVDGYLGRILLEKQKTDSARLLLKNAVQASIRFNELSDAASFSNDLAAIDYQQQKFPEALHQWKTAWTWALLSNDQQAAMDAAAGLSKTFRKIHQTDSAFFYSDLYHQFRDTLAGQLNQSRLNVINTKIDYENIQESLRKSEEVILHQRKVRNLLIAGGLLVIIIILLLYNRSSIRQQHRTQLSEERSLRAEQEAADARDKLSLFRQHIIEKIALLQKERTTITHPENAPEEDLSTYVLLREEDWTRFKQSFTKAYPHFFHLLRAAIPNITPAQERLSALIYLKLDNTQAGACLGISPDSVARSKRRLRQVLGLGSDALLEEYILNIK